MLPDAERLADRVIETLREFVTDPDVDALARTDPETDMETCAEIVEPGEFVNEDDIDGLGDGDADMESDVDMERLRVTVPDEERETDTVRDWDSVLDTEIVRDTVTVNDGDIDVESVPVFIDEIVDKAVALLETDEDGDTDGDEEISGDCERLGDCELEPEFDGDAE